MLFERVNHPDELVVSRIELLLRSPEPRHPPPHRVVLANKNNTELVVYGEVVGLDCDDRLLTAAARNLTERPTRPTLDF